MSKLKFGLEFAMPEYPVPELVDMAALALDLFDFEQIWVSDNIQFRSAFVVLTAMALKLKAALGTAVIIPYPRNPLDMASAFASVSELMEERELAIGIGPGGHFYKTMGRMVKPAATVRETIKITRTLLNGEAVKFEEFPILCSLFNLRGEATAKLEFVARKSIPIYVAVGGPRMLKIAGELGDGVIYNMLTPVGSNVGIERGFFKEAVKTVEDARKRAGVPKPFRRIYLAHISVFDDEELAKYFAKRNVSYAIAETPDFWLMKIGIEPDHARAVREAYNRGLGMDGAARVTTDEMVEALAIAGTPRQCVDKLAEVLKFVSDYDQVVLDVATVGPEMPKALRLLASEVLPSLV